MIPLSDMMRPRTPMERELHGESEHGSPVGSIQLGPRSSMAEYVAEQTGSLTANITRNEMVWQATLAIGTGLVASGAGKDDLVRKARRWAVELVENELNARRDLGTVESKDGKSLGMEKPPEK